MLAAALCLAAAGVGLGTAGVVLGAESLPPAPARHFNDYAHLVDAATAERLDEKLRAFEEQTSTQIVVALFPELPSPSLEDFTVRTAQSWRAGQKKLHNGAVLFVFVKDRKMRIEVGYGLEGPLPDITANRIIEDVIRPAFRNNQHAAGLEAGIDAMMAATRGEYTAAPRSAAKPSSGRGILCVVISLLLLNMLIGRRMTRKVGGRRRWSSGTVGWGSGGGGGWSSGGWSGGSGRSSGGGGFSGGGGSFGGGGASGSW